MADLEIGARGLPLLHHGLSGDGEEAELVSLDGPAQINGILCAVPVAGNANSALSGQAV
jgi:hypothetical protein